jgi:hypothetical protein
LEKKINPCPSSQLLQTIEALLHLATLASIFLRIMKTFLAPALALHCRLIIDYHNSSSHRMLMVFTTQYEVLGNLNSGFKVLGGFVLRGYGQRFWDCRVCGILWFSRVFSDLVFHKHKYTHYSHMQIEKDREGRESS